MYARGQRRGQHVPCLEYSAILEHAMGHPNVTLMPQYCRVIPNHSLSRWLTFHTEHTQYLVTLSLAMQTST